MDAEHGLATELGLAELVSRVREELERVDNERAWRGADALLALEDVQLELQFTLVHRRDAKGGIDLKIVSLEGAKGVESSAVHKVSVRFAVEPEARDRGLPGSRAHAASARKRRSEPAPIDDPE